jgi:hypothetical protein
MTAPKAQAQADLAPDYAEIARLLIEEALAAAADAEPDADCQEAA